MPRAGRKPSPICLPCLEGDTQIRARCSARRSGRGHPPAAGISRDSGCGAARNRVPARAGVALMAARGWGSEEVLDAFERAGALCESSGERSRLFSTLRGRAQYYMISGKPAAAQELAERCAKIVENNPDQGLRIETDHMFWTNNFFLGNLAKARKHAESAIICYDAERDHRLTYVYSGHDPGVCCRCFAGLSAWLSGDPATARKQCLESSELAEYLQHPLTTALAYWGSSYLHIFAGEAEDALHWAERELSTAERFQFPLLVGRPVSDRLGTIPTERSHCGAQDAGRHSRHPPHRRGDGASIFHRPSCRGTLRARQVRGGSRIGSRGARPWPPDWDSIPARGGAGH